MQLYALTILQRNGKTIFPGQTFDEPDAVAPDTEAKGLASRNAPKAATPETAVEGKTKGKPA